MLKHAKQDNKEMKKGRRNVIGSANSTSSLASSVSGFSSATTSRTQSRAQSTGQLKTINTIPINKSTINTKPINSSLTNNNLDNMKNVSTTITTGNKEVIHGINTTTRISTTGIDNPDRDTSVISDVDQDAISALSFSSMPLTRVKSPNELVSRYTNKNMNTTTTTINNNDIKNKSPDISTVMNRKRVSFYNTYFLLIYYTYTTHYTL